MNARPKDLGLELTRHDLYPPILDTQPGFVIFRVAVTDPVEFDFTFNGESGEFPGVTFFIHGNQGAISFWPEFLASYDGPWPARVEIRAWQEGVMMDSAELRIHDTRIMVVHRAELALSADTVTIPPGLFNSVDATPVFFDAQDVQLPLAEVSWELLLPQAQPGVDVDGPRIRVMAGALPGKLTVLLRERSGVEDTAILGLLAPPEIGMELSQYDLYPPLVGIEAHVAIRSELPPDAHLHYDLVVNGVPGPHPGLGTIFPDGWFAVIDKAFIANYAGAWPVELTVYAHLDHELVASRTLWLHDTREMECVRMDFRFSPSDSVDIPEQGELLVLALPTFWDAQDIELPFSELHWDAHLLEPVDGVELLGHVLHISPEARPGSFRVGIRMDNGLNRARVLNLT